MWLERVALGFLLESPWYAPRSMHSAPTEELLGPLNPIAKKHVSAMLWTSGDNTLLRHHPRVAIVGTRSPSPEGERRTRQLVRELVRHGAIVVSGLAAGIDTIAHTTTLDLGGRTIAVIGTPLNDVFPKSNTALQARIAREHLVVSEFPLGQPVAKGNFVRRNRTMALIADASVIIEAGEGSGTLSQGWEALRLGRPLFILRSVVESSLEWPKQMRDYGALTLTRATDLLDLLPSDDIRHAVAF